MIRIYDLAKELKQDSKRIMEEARREGADVNVASNPISDEIANRVRNKYFPKGTSFPARSLKILKSDKVIDAKKIPYKVSQPEYKKCYCCGRHFRQKEIKNHEANCEKDSALIHFRQDRVEQFSKQIDIEHTPILDSSIRKSKRCRNDGCENNVGLDSDICYGCICNSK